MQPTPPPPPARPGTVFLGAYLYAGVCALLLTVVVASFWVMPEYRRYIVATGEVANASAAVSLAVGFFVVCAMFWGAVSLILAYFAGQGRRAARILTWIAAGITLLVCGFMLYLGVAPISWFDQLTLGLNAAMMLLSAASIVLLALPASSRYYREVRAAALARRAQQWRPIPPPYRPAFPSYPPAPGPFPGYPPHPGAPQHPAWQPALPPPPQLPPGQFPQAPPPSGRPRQPWLPPSPTVPPQGTAARPESIRIRNPWPEAPEGSGDPT
jgi:hypothetical protein